MATTPSEFTEISKTDFGDTTSARIKTQVQNQLIEIEPDQNKFLVFQKRMGRIRTVPNITHYVNQEWPHERRLKVTTASAIADTTPTVDYRDGLVDGQVFSAYDEDMNALGFDVRITTNPNTTGQGTITVSRPYAGTDAAIPANGWLIGGRNVRVEGAAKTTARVKMTESIQFFQTHLSRAVGISTWQKLTEMNGPPDRLRVNNQLMREFMKDIEECLIDGKQVNDTSTAGSRMAHTRGLIEHAKHYFNAQQTNRKLDLKKLFELMWLGQRQAGVGNYFVLCSNAFAAEFAWAAAKLGIARQDAFAKRLDMNIDTIQPPGFSGTLTTLPTYHLDDRNEIVIYNPDHVRMTQMSNMYFERDQQDNGEQQEEWAAHWIVGLETPRPQGIVHVDNVDGLTVDGML